MKKNNRVYLQQILEAIVKVRQYLEKLDLNEFLKDEIIQDATIRKLAVIGEGVRRLQSCDEFKEAVKMRNKLIHDYDDIHLEVVWKTVKNDLPVMEKKVRSFLKNLGK